MSYPLKKVLEVMKPCNPDKDKPTHMRRLNEALDGDSYVGEEKFDGCRYLAINNRFFSTHIAVRDGESTGWPVEKTAQLAPLVASLCYAGLNSLILDGEVVFPGGKAQDVVGIAGCLPQEAIDRQRDTPLHYMVFDVLRSANGRSMLSASWEVRRLYLEGLAGRIESDLIHIVPVVEDNKRAFLDKMLAEGHEGIILKDREGMYLPGKRPMWNWVKCKAELDDDVVIMDFELPVKAYTGKDPENWPYREEGEPVTKFWSKGWIGAVLFGKYREDGQLVRLGTCSGMDEATRADMSYNPEKYVQQVAKITAMEITRDGAYRHPRFIMLHPDKDAQACKLED